MLFSEYKKHVLQNCENLSNPIVFDRIIRNLEYVIKNNLNIYDEIDDDEAVILIQQASMINEH